MEQLRSHNKVVPLKGGKKTHTSLLLVTGDFKGRVKGPNEHRRLSVHLTGKTHTHCYYKRSTMRYIRFRKLLFSCLDLTSNLRLNA